METLPIDLITDIFLRLPAKTLIRFKIVCKLWYHIISDARFGSQHLERSISTDTNLHFVITSPMLRLADFDNPVELNYPYNDPDRGGVSIVGSCNGLLLLTIYDNYINEYNLSMMLYNPTTQTHKFLPLLPRPDQLAYPRGHYSYGLGFDSVSNDYKCVRIDQYSFKETDTEAEYFYSEVMVYSLRNDYWRRGPDVPHYFFNNWGFSVLFRETLHWVGHGGADDRVPQPIVGFNLQDENFSILLLPDFDMEYSVTLHLGVMDGCLCLLVNHIEYTDAWIMKEYGMVDSWIKLYSIVKRKDIQHVERTVCYSRSEKKLFIRICLLQLAYLDLETLETTNIKISDKFKCFDAYLCVENLLMLNDADYDSFEEELPSIKKRKKKGKKKRRRRKRHASASAMWIKDGLYLEFALRLGGQWEEKLQVQQD